MAPPLIQLQDIHLTFGGTPLLEGAELSVSGRERLCLVGRNGSGKSTLLKIAAGLVQADDGRRFLQPGVTVRYLPQEPDLSRFSTVLAYVESGLGAGDDAHRARLLLEGLGLTGDENPGRPVGRRGAPRRAGGGAGPRTRHIAARRTDQPSRSADHRMAGGRAGGSALGYRSDQPRPPVSRKTVADHAVARSRGSRACSNAISPNSRTGATRCWSRKNSTATSSTARSPREQDWIVHGVSGRRKRNQGRLRALADLRQQRQEQRSVTGSVRLEATAAATSGKQVVEAEAVSKSYGERPIVRNFSTRILRGDRVGIIGANGAGKTTLLMLLTGAMAPDSGKVKVGGAVQMVSLDQQRASLDPDWTLSQALTGGHGDTVVIDGKPRHVVSYMRDFLFTPEQGKTPVGNLSGGERGRLMLARALAQPSNLLVLDEPTNDLDLETLDLLQEMLADYSGTVILVSHDRDFLDRVVTSVIVSGRRRSLGRICRRLFRHDRPAGAGHRWEARGENPSRARRAPEAPLPRPPAPSKFSFRDRDALAKLSARIETLQSRMAAHRVQLADPDLYRRDPAKFQAVTGALAAGETELAAAEEQWLALEMRREALEG